MSEYTRIFPARGGGSGTASGRFAPGGVGGGALAPTTSLYKKGEHGSGLVPNGGGDGISVIERGDGG